MEKERKEAKVRNSVAWNKCIWRWKSSVKITMDRSKTKDVEEVKKKAESRMMIGGNKWQQALLYVGQNTTYRTYAAPFTLLNSQDLRSISSQLICCSYRCNIIDDKHQLIMQFLASGCASSRFFKILRSGQRQVTDTPCKPVRNREEKRRSEVNNGVIEKKRVKIERRRK